MQSVQNEILHTKKKRIILDLQQLIFLTNDVRAADLR